ncbi:hypothetical protein AGMMS50225_15690 [Betaproteobacteria bacterium]|nr:hypothetical protein AGMMS50225_15690 [Betaproteobacteria bacterium]
MRKNVFFLVAALVAFCGSPAQAQSLTLSDAVYFYTYPIKSTGAAKKLIGHNCDVFELALKVQSGYTDLIVTEGSSSFNYPDRINSGAAMFAYTLYSAQADKRFTLVGKSTGGVQQVGTATIFGYCFSTKADAWVMLYDEVDKTCRHSNGTVISNCPVN